MVKGFGKLENQVLVSNLPCTQFTIPFNISIHQLVLFMSVSHACLHLVNKSIEKLLIKVFYHQTIPWPRVWAAEE